MKKISDIILRIFGIGVTVCLFAGAVAILGFIAALIIGGEIATQICVFIHKTYFPYVIQITSIFVGLGLIGMYMNKIKALTVGTGQNENTQK